VQHIAGGSGRPIDGLGDAGADSQIEAELLGLLAAPTDDDDRICASAALGQCDTHAAIPARLLFI
jgi:hypothetical protein